MSVDHAPKPQPHTTPPNTPAPTTQPQTPPTTKPTKPKTKRIGRPPLYTPELADTVLDRIALGESLRSVCRDPKMPSLKVVRGWVDGTNGGDPAFGLRYARARQARADLMAEDILKIADEAKHVDFRDTAAVQAAKLRVDARKWLAARMDPKHWGDRVQHDVTAQRVADAPPAFDPLEHLDDDDRQLMRRLAEKAVRRSQLGQGQK